AGVFPGPWLGSLETMNRKRILIATDAWPPQVSGVVRTVMTTVETLRGLGHLVEVVHPRAYRGFPVPFYKEVRLNWPSRRGMRARMARFRPGHVPIVTEGTIGLAVRAACL